MKTQILANLINNVAPRIEESRNYIGASSIGHQCLRHVWYKYKGYEGEPITIKQQLTFEIGKKLEELLVNKIISNKSIVNKEVFIGKQFICEYVEEFKGSADLVLDSAIIEIKTAKNSSFQQFVNKGLLSWNEQYYAQIQSYMGMSGIHKGYLLALNKDTSELWDEEITFDPEYYAMLVNRAKLIRDAEIEPPRCNGSPLYFICQQCQFRKICHQ